MATSNTIVRYVILSAGLFVLSAFGSESAANQGGFQIGGPNGVVIGGGEGLRIGGSDGVQFGGGEGAKFGGPGGVQFGGGKGAKFGGPDGVQFGGGAGAKFGPVQIGGDSNASPSGPNPSMTSPSMTVHYPADARQPLDFTLNGWKYTLEPGETVQLRGDRLWIIQFARGSGGRERQYSLPPGSYTFKHSRRGWDLLRNKAARSAE